MSNEVSMQLDALPAALQITVILLIASALAAFLFAFLGIASTIFKAKVWLVSNDEKSLSRGERWGRQNRRMNPFLLSPEYKLQRIFVFGGFSGFFLCFISLFVIAFSVGG